jgi:type I restriction enzyme S subunit
MTQYKPTPPPGQSGANQSSPLANQLSPLSRPGFKHTKLGWLPEEWEVVPIGQIVNLLSGYAFSSSNYSDKGIRLLRGANVKRGDISWDDSVTKFWPQNKIGNKLEKYFLAENDLIIAMDGSLVGRSYGIIKAHDLPCLLLQRVARIRSKKLSTGFLKALVGSPLFVNYCDRVKTVTAIPHISSKDIKNFKIPLPPLPEQHRIARCLTTWDRAITTTRTLLDHLRRRKRGLMQRLLTGEVRLPGFGSAAHGKVKTVKLESISKKISNGLTYNTRIIGQHRISRIETIADGEINLNKTGFAEDGVIRPDYKLNHGDILYSHINSVKHIGKVAYFDLSEVLYHGMNLVRIQPNPLKVDSKYLYYWLYSDLGRRWAWKLAKKAVNQASISTSELKSIKISLPSPKEQTAIARVLTAADREIELYEQKLTALETQKRGLMQQLLTGQKRLPSS